MNENSEEQNSEQTIITLSGKFGAEDRGSLVKSISLKDVAIQQLSCGLNFAVFLDQRHFLHSLGENYLGQLGDGSFEPCFDEVRQVKIRSGRQITRISCGYTHSIAYNGKEVYGWGQHKYGALGYQESQVLNPSMPKKLPILIASGEQLISASTGNNTTILNVSGSFFGLGTNENRQLGLKLKRVSIEPELLRAFSESGDEETLVDIACGDGFTVGLGASGRLYGCGDVKKIGLEQQDTKSYANGLNPLTVREGDQSQCLRGIKKLYCSNFLAVLTDHDEMRVFGCKNQNPFIVGALPFNADSCLEIQAHSQVCVVTSSSGQYSWGQLPQINELTGQSPLHLHPPFTGQSSLPIKFTKHPQNLKISLCKNDGSYLLTELRQIFQNSPESDPLSTITINRQKSDSQQHVHHLRQAKKSEQMQTMTLRLECQHKQIEEQSKVINLYEQYVKKLESENAYLRQRQQEKDLRDGIQAPDEIEGRLVELRYILHELLDGVTDQ